jgi:amidase
MVADTVNAFIETFDPPLGDRDAGPLSGLTFAAKDNFDVAGKATGYGNPTWRSQATPARRNASAIQRLIDAGAKLVGKTHLDDLAYSLLGMNVHYGTPVNSAAPDRVPGGSSSGSASAVAAGLVDFALGSDTGGSVRAPASFCGLYGLRPSHGGQRPAEPASGGLPEEGLLPLAGSFDTAGYFARDPDIMDRIGAALGLQPADVGDARLWAPQALWETAEDATAEALRPMLSNLEDQFGPAGGDPLPVAEPDAWFQTFRICQAYEIWQTMGPWITSRKPAFGPGVKERFDFASQVSPDAFEAARARRALMRDALGDVMGDDRIVVIPTAPSPAPLLASSNEALDAFRNRALTLLCIAGNAGLPQLSVPGATVEGAPVGLSLIGPRGSERRLIAIARLLAAG